MKKEAKQKDVMICKRSVKERGWTERLIDQFLGEADREVKNLHHTSGGRMKLYKMTRIEAAEALPEFQAAKEKASRRSEVRRSASAKIREETISEVGRIKINVPQIEQSRLIQSACQGYNDHLIERHQEYGNVAEDISYRFVDEGSDSKFLSRICVNYLRHRTTRYDTYLDRVFGKVGRDEAHMLLREKTMEAIAAQYPWLADECKRQLEQADEQMAMKEAFGR